MEEREHVRYYRVPSYGLFWLSLVALVLLAKLDGARPRMTRRWLHTLPCGIVHRVMFIGTLQLNRALQVVFATLTILFFMLAIGDYTGASVGFNISPATRNPLRLLRDLRRARTSAQ